MSSKEEENYCRLFNLISNTGKKVLEEYMSTIIQGISIVDLVNKNKHQLFHFWKNKSQCCNCSITLRSSTNQILRKVQWDELFMKTNSRCKTQRQCICEYIARTGLGYHHLDISLITCIMLNCLTMSTRGKHYVEKVREWRNRVHHKAEKKLTDEEFCQYWQEVKISILNIAKKCSHAKVRSFEHEIDSRLKADLSPSTTFELIRTMKEVYSERYSYEENLAVVTEQLKKLDGTPQEILTKLNLKEETSCLVSGFPSCQPQQDHLSYAQSIEPITRCYQTMTSVDQNLMLECNASVGTNTPCTAEAQTVTLQQMYARNQRMQTEVIYQAEYYTNIRRRLRELETYLLDNLNPNYIISYDYRHALLSSQQKLQIQKETRRRDRAKILLQILSETNDGSIQEFLFILCQTEQGEIHDVLTRDESVPAEHVCVQTGVPYRHNSDTESKSIQLHIECQGANGIAQEETLRKYIENNPETINEITNRLSTLSLHRTSEGSVIIHLRTTDSSRDALDCIQRSFINGNLKAMIFAILAKSGIAKEAVAHVTIKVTKVKNAATHKRQGQTVYDRHLEYLLEELCPKPVASVLHKKGVLDLREVSLVFCDDHWDRKSQVKQLIAIMKTKQGVVDHFIEALRDTFQSYIAETLSIEAKSTDTGDAATNLNTRVIGTEHKHGEHKEKQHLGHEQEKSSSSHLKDIGKATNVKSACDRGTQDEGTADNISEMETGIDAMDLQVKKWKQDDKMCYVTKAIHHALQKISVQNYLAVIGVPGSGKTTTIRHVALTLQEREGYIIYPLKQPFHFRKYLKKNKKQIFLIDDPVGEYVIQKKKLEMWDDHNEEIKDCLEVSENTKFLTSLRVQLYEDASLKGKAYIFNDPDHITNLGDGELKLEMEEMKNMLRMYLKAKNVNNIEELVNNIWWSTYQTDTQFAECFPLLCKVFTENEYARRDPARYFEDPFVALTKIFLRIKSENNIQFCGLVLCAMLELKDEHFSPYIETDDRDVRDTAIKSLDLDPERSLKKIKEALKTLDNVYISHIGNDYVFSHSIFHNIVTFIFDDAGFVFRHGRMDFLLSRVRINSRLPGDDEYVLVFSGEKNVELLVDRMIQELKINMWLGAFFVTQFYLINDDKILACLKSKLLESNDADITNHMIHALFARCIECVWRHCKTHKEDQDESGWPCYKLLKILSERVDCNTQVMAGQYPIHLSVETGSLILAKLLINNKANVNQLDAYRRSVLHYALKAKNNIEMTRYLLSLESFRCLHEVDSQQKTPYSYLLESDVENKEEIIAMYKERGACDLVENRVI